MDRFGLLRQKLEERLPQLELREGEPMRAHTTFRVGGPAALMALPKSAEELGELLRTAAELELPPFFLGKGSNLLVADEGVDAFLIKMAGGLDRLHRIDEAAIYAESGATMAQVAGFAQESGLSGLEFAHGIPGTLGGGVFMNAGAYDGELAQVVRRVDCLDLMGIPHSITGDELQFGYRHSVFSRLPWLITGVTLQLHPGDPEEIRERMRELMSRRRAKQPLDYPSAGSTFKRPPGHFAGGLIEQCGLKGKIVGGAQVSEKHAGFLINTGGATCRDILALIRLVRETVARETGVVLEPEVRTLGCTVDD